MKKSRSPILLGLILAGIMVLMIFLLKDRGKSIREPVSQSTETGSVSVAPALEMESHPYDTDDEEGEAHPILEEPKKEYEVQHALQPSLPFEDFLNTPVLLTGDEVEESDPGYFCLITGEDTVVLHFYGDEKSYIENFDYVFPTSDQTVWEYMFKEMRIKSRDSTLWVMLYNPEDQPLLTSTCPIVGVTINEESGNVALEGGPLGASLQIRIGDPVTDLLANYEPTFVENVGDDSYYLWEGETNVLIAKSDINGTITRLSFMHMDR